MQIQGTILLKRDTQFVTEKFSKREFIVKTTDQYPQEISIELHKDKCGLLDKFQMGQEITAHININGKSWTNKDGKKVWFNTIVAWRIEGATSTQTTADLGATPKEEPAHFATDTGDDTPF